MPTPVRVARGHTQQIQLSQTSSDNRKITLRDPMPLRKTDSRSAEDRIGLSHGFRSSHVAVGGEEMRAEGDRERNSVPVPTTVRSSQYNSLSNNSNMMSDNADNKYVAPISATNNNFLSFPRSSELKDDKGSGGNMEFAKNTMGNTPLRSTTTRGINVLLSTPNQKAAAASVSRLTKMGSELELLSSTLDNIDKRRSKVITKVMQHLH